MCSVAGYSLSEMTFAPRKRGAPEGDGYLSGLGGSQKEAGRSDLIIFDTKAVAEGPVARVKMPFKRVRAGSWLLGRCRRSSSRGTGTQGNEGSGDWGAGL